MEGEVVMTPDAIRRASETARAGRFGSRLVMALRLMDDAALAHADHLETKEKSMHTFNVTDASGASLNIKAERIQLDDGGAILFYEDGALVAVVSRPLSVVRS